MAMMMARPSEARSLRVPIRRRAVVLSSPLVGSSAWQMHQLIGGAWTFRV